MSNCYRIPVLVGLALVLTLSANTVLALHANEGAELPLADVNGFSLSVKASLLVVGGEARELVYAGSASRDLPADYQVSELIWDITSLAMAGGTVSAQFGERFRINAGAWFGLNEGSGGMEDYDWLDSSISDWTHYSESDVDIEAAYSIDVNASLELFDLGIFTCSGIIGYKHDFWEWSDYGGSYIYSSAGFRDDRGSFGGENGIDYEQTFDIPYFGVQLATSGSSVRASAYLLYSPFVIAEDKDHHIFRNLYFREEFEGGDFLAFGGDVSIDLTETFFISGAIDAQVIPEFTGDLYSKEGLGGAESMSPDGAGIENVVAAFSASAGLRF
ncbi:MAG: omptin family outer membrane protease [Verrucomicrobia bacterium]|jgi:outer membrane protease|nr:omptin family outer membrane protease [Verrucomicrobiota bacterium]MBT7065917.1 omptin family outer membrane protease [Verrucomicrobiota bacterium]MBT7699435.1 omptin family outer membrane protease [Verrucomicrobiota bacterium]